MATGARASTEAEDSGEVTRRTYDAIAAEYGVTATPELRAWKEAGMRRFAALLPGKRVLVPGCGDGRDSRYLAGLGMSVRSFDYSEGMLRQARERDPGGSYERRDLREMETLGENVDGIWASGCLYHLSKAEFDQWLSDAAARLRAGGVLYLSMKEGAGERFEEAPGPGYPGGEKAKAVLRGRRFYAYYSREELTKLLSERFTLVHEQRADFGERNFEFFVRRRAG